MSPDDLKTSGASLQKADPAEWQRRFEEFLASLDPNTPVLSDYAMSRESIYAGRDEEVGTMKTPARNTGSASFTPASTGLIKTVPRSIRSLLAAVIKSPLAGARTACRVWMKLTSWMTKGHKG